MKDLATIAALGALFAFLVAALISTAETVGAWLLKATFGLPAMLGAVTFGLSLLRAQPPAVVVPPIERPVSDLWTCTATTIGDTDVLTCQDNTGGRHIRMVAPGPEDQAYQLPVYE